jgi:hypothetical protein
MSDRVRPLHADEEMARIRESLKTKGTSGGGGGDGMLEERVKRIEVDLTELRVDMKNVRDRLAKMEGEISRLPGYPGLFVICGTLVALVGLMVRFL